MAPPSSSSTALQMNLFDRFTRVAKSNLNNILKNLEDPEKIMNQAVEDMQVREDVVWWKRCCSGVARTLILRRSGYKHVYSQRAPIIHVDGD